MPRIRLLLPADGCRQAALRGLTRCGRGRRDEQPGRPAVHQQDAPEQVQGCHPPPPLPPPQPLPPLPSAAARAARWHRIHCTPHTRPPLPTRTQDIYPSREAIEFVSRYWRTHPPPHGVRVPSFKTSAGFFGTRPPAFYPYCTQVSPTPTHSPTTRTPTHTHARSHIHNPHKRAHNAGIIIAMHLCARVDVYGFDFGVDHYYKKRRLARRPSATRLAYHF